MKDEDVEITVGCEAAHPDWRGGQHVAKQCTGVRATHRPTGLTVLADGERSQRANLERALELLRQLVAIAG